MSTVIIWENNMLSGGRSKCADGKTRKWPGHASMNIGDVWQRLGEDNTDNYVSWWPGGKRDTSKSAQAGAAITKQGVTANGVAKHNLCLDIIKEGYLPDHIIRLDVTEGQIRNMQAKWNEIRHKEGANYRFVVKNCSTIVARVLRAGNLTVGGATGWWRNHSMIWTPNKIKEMADGAGGNRMTWAALWAELQRSGIDITSDLGMVSKARDKRFCSCGAPCKF